MIDRLLHFVLDRQPVQAATGIAGLLIGALGVAHEFDLLETLTVAQVTAIGGFLTLLAGWLGHTRAWSPASVEARVAQVSIPNLTVAGPEEPAGEEGFAPIWVLAGVALLIAAIFIVCDAALDDEDEDDDLGWVPGIESSERPGGRDGPGRDGEEECDGSCGNRPGNDCNQSQNCSDDDQLQIGPICVEPESCRFG